MTRSVAEIRASARARPPTKVLFSNNSYAHDEQKVKPGQASGFNCVLYKL